MVSAADPESAGRLDPTSRRAAAAVRRDPEWLPAKNRQARPRRALRNHRRPSRVGRGPAMCGSLPEDVFDLAEDAAIIFFVTRRRLDFLFRQRRGELLQQFLLFLAEPLRRHDLDGDQQIAVAAAGYVGHALAAQLEGGAGLRAFGNLDRLVAVETRHLDLAAERERRECQRHGAMQIVAVALKELVLTDEDHDVEIPRRAAERASFAFSGEPQPLTGGNAGGDLHRQLAHFLDAAFAAASGAGLGDHLARTAALTAGPRDREKALLVAQLTGAAALRAARRRCARSGAVAVAGFTRLVPRNLDVGLDAFRRLLELDLEVVAQIGAALRT